MKIIFKGLNGEFVNFDNVFKIDVSKPFEEGNPWKVIAYSGYEFELYNHGKCILFQGTEEEVKNWQEHLQKTIADIPYGTSLIILETESL